MNTALKEHLINILESIEATFSYNEESEVFSIMIRFDSSAYYLALWHREGINTLRFFAPLSKPIPEKELNGIAFDLLEFNEDIVFGSIGAFQHSDSDLYRIVFNHSFTLERGEAVNITKEEIDELLSYCTYLFPMITEKIDESVGAVYSV